MHQVLADLERVVTPQRSRVRLHRVGHPHQPTHPVDRPGTLDHDRDQRSGGDEVDQLAEERLLGLLGVVLLGRGPVQRAQLQRHQRQTLALQPGDHLAGEATAYAVGLDENESALGHRRSPSSLVGRVLTGSDGRTVGGEPTEPPVGGRTGRAPSAGRRPTAPRTGRPGRTAARPTVRPRSPAVAGRWPTGGRTGGAASPPLPTARRPAKPDSRWRLRRRFGRPLATVLQPLVIAAGLLAWPLFVLGALFGALWVGVLRMERGLSGPPPAAR